MRVRLARKSDPLPAHLDPSRDTVFVAERPDGTIEGHIALRPMLYTHSFELADGPRRRLIAEALFHQALGFAQHALSFARPGEYAAYGSIFHTREDNERMKTFLESKGATREADAATYRIDLNP